MEVKLHKNAKTTPAIRKEIQESKESISALARKYGISRQTVRKWKNRDRVEDKSSRPHKLRTTLTKEEEDMIIYERKQYKKSAEEIYATLKDKIKGLYPMKVYRCLKRHGMGRLPEEFVKEERRIKKFKKYSEGYLHIDVLYAPKINKERRYVFTCIDRVSKIAFVEVRKSKGQRDGKEFLEKVLRYYPYKINYILTDNGAEFSYNTLPHKTRKIHPFDKLCNERGIKHRTIKFRQPWTNGMIERFNGKIKEKVFKRFFFEGIEDLERKLIEWVNDYNFNVALRGLGYKTPAEYIYKKLGYRIKKIEQDK